MIQTLNALSELKPNYTPRKIEDKKILSKAQKLMLNCLLNGHHAYSKDYIKGLSTEEKRKIIYRSNTAYQVLNECKQIKLNQTVVSIVNQICPGLCGNAAEILTTRVLDRNFKCDDTIKELHLTMDETIKALMRSDLLPQDFYQL